MSLNEDTFTAFLKENSDNRYVTIRIMKMRRILSKFEGLWTNSKMSNVRNQISLLVLALYRIMIVLCNNTKRDKKETIQDALKMYKALQYFPTQEIVKTLRIPYYGASSSEKKVLERERQKFCSYWETFQQGYDWEVFSLKFRTLWQNTEDVF